jgi:hypothetical protein
MRRTKVEFKGTFLLAMREKDPKLFMALKREKKLDSYVQRICQEASEMVTGLLRSSPKDKWGL